MNLMQFPDGEYDHRSLMSSLGQKCKDTAREISTGASIKINKDDGNKEL